jgi:hypothetical protein
VVVVVVVLSEHELLQAHDNHHHGHACEAAIHLSPCHRDTHLHNTPVTGHRGAPNSPAEIFFHFSTSSAADHNQTISQQPAIFLEAHVVLRDAPPCPPALNMRRAGARLAMLRVAERRPLSMEACTRSQTRGEHRPWA